MNNDWNIIDDGIIPEASKKQKNDGGAKNQAESRDERTGTELKRAKNLTGKCFEKLLKIHVLLYNIIVLGICISF